MFYLEDKNRDRSLTRLEMVSLLTMHFPHYPEPSGLMTQLGYTMKVNLAEFVTVHLLLTLAP